MDSPPIPIMILISLACVSILYSFVCNIRLARQAEQLSEWVREQRPELWLGLNAVARNWNGGHPGLKLLHRRNDLNLPDFERRYQPLRALERKFLWGLGIGVACITLMIAGIRLWGWQW